MRELTIAELELVAGGTETRNGIPVSDLPGPTVTPDPTPSGPISGPSDSSPPPSSDGSSPSGSGSSSTAIHSLSPEGRVLNYHVSLDASQLAVMGAIVDYGVDHRFSSDAVRIAVDQAYYESSFRQSATNGSHVGLYQYNQDGWNIMGHTGADINDQNAQIAAIYNDIMVFGQQYTQLHSAGNIPWELSFEDYFEIKHHLGPYYANPGDAASMNVVNGYNDVANQLGVGAE